MGTTQKRALARFRSRRKRQGIIRLEIQVRRDDASLVRSVVRALADPERERETRILLRERFGAAQATGLKALLAAAPLDGIELDRAYDTGRDVDL